METKSTASAPSRGSAGVQEPVEVPRVRKIEMTPAEPVDLLAVAGAPVLKRVAPVAGVIVLLLLILRARQRAA